MTVSKAIVIAFTAIITLFGTGVFNMTQAQEGASPSPSSPPITSPSPSSPPITSPSPSSPPITSPSPSSPPTNHTVLPAVKTKLCDPNNPKLSFVNTTESNICGIPKTIKNVTTTTPTPTPTSKPISPLSPKPISPLSPKPISPLSPKPISPLSPRSITPPSEPSPQEDIPGLP
ncbi:MAG: hypothetical protein WA421_17840 [Nitrososphaeraceae archaeon]